MAGLLLAAKVQAAQVQAAKVQAANCWRPRCLPLRVRAQLLPGNRPPPPACEPPITSAAPLDPARTKPRDTAASEKYYGAARQRPSESIRVPSAP